MFGAQEKSPPIRSLIGEGTVVQGDLTFTEGLRIDGEVHGNVLASEKVDIRDGGSVDGDIVSPRVAIAEGAHFRGSVDMQRKGQPAAGKGAAAAAAAPQSRAQLPRAVSARQKAPPVSSSRAARARSAAASPSPARAPAYGIARRAHDGTDRDRDGACAG